MLIILNFVMATLACRVACVTDDKPDILTMPIGISGSYLTTSIGIGTPPQYFDLAIQLDSDKSYFLDTSTRNTKIDFNYDYIKSIFLPTESDSVSISQQICRARFTNKRNNNVNLAYGHYATDLITISDITLPVSARLCNLDEQRTADYTSYDPLNWFMTLPIDGFLGLAPGAENILRRSTNDLKQISLFVNKKYTEIDNAGTIIYGGPDTTNCQKFESFPAEDSDSWRIWVTKASFHGTNISDTFSTLIDLSSDTLVVPQKIYSAIVSYFGGTTSSITCSSYPNPPELQIEIYGKTYSIPIKPYLQPNQGQTYQCRLNIETPSTNDANQIVLNRYLLNNYCLLLDYDESSIGLAKFN